MKNNTLKFHGSTANITDRAISLTHGRVRRMGGVPEHVTIPFSRITRVRHDKPKGMSSGVIELITPDYNPTGAGRAHEVVYTKKQQAAADALVLAAMQNQQALTPAQGGIDRAAYAARQQADTKPIEKFAGWTLTRTTIESDGQQHRIQGAHATVESSGDMGKQVRAGRVITGGILFGPAGAVVGGLLRKSRNQIYITITFPNGDTGLIEAPAKQETDARRFATAINNAAK